MLKKTFYIISILFFFIITDVSADTESEEIVASIINELKELTDSNQLLDLPKEYASFYEVGYVNAWTYWNGGWVEIGVKSFVGILEKQNKKEIVFIIKLGNYEVPYVLKSDLPEGLRKTTNWFDPPLFWDSHYLESLGPDGLNPYLKNINESWLKHREWKKIAIENNVEVRKLMVENIHPSVESKYSLQIDIEFYSTNELPYENEISYEKDTLIYRANPYEPHKKYTNLVWRFYDCINQCEDKKIVDEYYFEPEYGSTDGTPYSSNKLYSLVNPLMMLYGIANLREQRETDNLFQ